MWLSKGLKGVWWGVWSQYRFNYEVWTAFHLPRCVWTQVIAPFLLSVSTHTCNCACVSVYVCVTCICVIVCVCLRASGAMANASPDLDNAEAQRQLNNNNRPIGSGFWETECTSSKLFECSRIKALAGQRSHADRHACVPTSIQANTPQTHLSQRVY